MNFSFLEDKNKSSLKDCSVRMSSECKIKKLIHSTFGIFNFFRFTCSNLNFLVRICGVFNEKNAFIRGIFSGDVLVNQYGFHRNFLGFGDER